MCAAVENRNTTIISKLKKIILHLFQPFEMNAFTHINHGIASIHSMFQVAQMCMYNKHVLFSFIIFEPNF